MRRILGGTALAFALALTACSDATSPDNKTPSALGVYTLTKLNNLAMPVPLGGFYGFTLEYTSSIMSLAGDSSYHERSIITERVDGKVTRVDTTDAFGLWRQKNSRVVLRDLAATDSIIGTFNNNALTFDITLQDSVFHYVYKRQ